jgi:hypothetical protein
MTERVAVVIGINYTHFPSGLPGETATRAGLNALRFAEADARDMAATLEASGYDVAPLLGIAATRVAIIDALRRQSRAAGDTGLLLVYFAGHGQIDPDDPDTAYLLPVDADPQNPADRAIPLDELAQRLLGRVRTALTLIDCCHSGYAVGLRGSAEPAGTGREFNRLAQNTFRNVRGRIALTACAGNQLAREIPRLQHGAFTYYTLDWWQRSAETDDLSLTSYVAAGLEKEGLPAPVRGGVQEGRIVLRPPLPQEPSRPAVDLAWRQEIYQLLRPLDDRQLRHLSYVLGFDYDALAGEDRQARTLRLILDLEAAGRTADLTAAAREAAARQVRDATLYRRLLGDLDPSRLPALAAAVGISYDTLPGPGPDDKLRRLIDEVEWAGRFADLEAAAQTAFAQQTRNRTAQAEAARQAQAAAARQAVERVAREAAPAPPPGVAAPPARDKALPAPAAPVIKPAPPGMNAWDPQPRSDAKAPAVPLVTPAPVAQPGVALMIRRIIGTNLLVAGLYSLAYTGVALLWQAASQSGLLLELAQSLLEPVRFPSESAIVAARPGSFIRDFAYWRTSPQLYFWQTVYQSFPWVQGALMALGAILLVVGGQRQNSGMRAYGAGLIIPLPILLLGFILGFGSPPAPSPLSVLGVGLSVIALVVGVILINSSRASKSVI